MASIIIILKGQRSEQLFTSSERGIIEGIPEEVAGNALELDHQRG